MMAWDVTAKIVLSLFLVGAAAWDLWTHRVPHLVTWPLLLAVVAAKAWDGSWFLPVLLTALVLVELLPQAWQLSTVAVVVGVGQSAAWMLDAPGARFVVLWWGVAYALWLLHVLGGADVRIFMALVALFPDPALVAALWGGFFVVSVTWLVVMYRRRAWLPLLQAGRGISGGRFPSLEELKERGRPTTPGLALGALAYVWFIL